MTASASYNRRLGERTNWQTTVAWGRRDFVPGRTLDGFLIESALLLDNTHTVFGRAERIANDELFAAPDPRTDRAFTVSKLSAGYIYDIPVLDHLKAGAGGLVSLYALPQALDSAMAATRSRSWSSFGRNSIETTTAMPSLDLPIGGSPICCLRQGAAP